MPEPIGSELSIDIKTVPNLEGMKDGDKCKLVISATRLGSHTHFVGKRETMVDIRIDEIEYEEEDEDKEEENGEPED